MGGSRTSSSRWPPRRRHRRDCTEQPLAVTQHLNAGHRIRAVSDRHRQIREHLPRHMQREPPVSVQQHPGHCIRQARLGGQLPQQCRPGVRHHATPVRADLDPAGPVSPYRRETRRLARQAPGPPPPGSRSPRTGQPSPAGLAPERIAGRPIRIVCPRQQRRFRRCRHLHVSSHLRCRLTPAVVAVIDALAAVLGICAVSALQH